MSWAGASSDYIKGAWMPEVLAISY